MYHFGGLGDWRWRLELSMGNEEMDVISQMTWEGSMNCEIWGLMVYSQPSF